MRDCPDYTPDEIRRANRIESTVLVAIAVVWIAFMAWLHLTQPPRERAAYEEGAREADRRAEAAGGWDAWIAAEVAQAAARN